MAIVTGGSQGLGAGLVAGYRRRGWAVVATSRTIKPPESYAALGPRLPPVGHVGQVGDIVDGGQIAGH